MVVVVEEETEADFRSSGSCARAEPGRKRPVMVLPLGHLHGDDDDDAMQKG